MNKALETYYKDSTCTAAWNLLLLLSIHSANGKRTFKIKKLKDSYNKNCKKWGLKKITTYEAERAISKMVCAGFVKKRSQREIELDHEPDEIIAMETKNAAISKKGA